MRLAADGQGRQWAVSWVHRKAPARPPSTGTAILDRPLLCRHDKPYGVIGLLVVAGSHPDGRHGAVIVRSSSRLGSTVADEFVVILTPPLQP